MSLETLLGGLGGHELILIAVIVFLMVGVSRVMGLQRDGSTGDSRIGAGKVASRAYADRLLGPIRSHISDDESPSEGPEPSSARARVPLLDSSLGLTAEQQRDVVEHLKSV